MSQIKVYHHKAVETGTEAIHTHILISAAENRKAEWIHTLLVLNSHSPCLIHPRTRVQGLLPSAVNVTSISAVKVPQTWPYRNNTLVISDIEKTVY